MRHQRLLRHTLAQSQHCWNCEFRFHAPAEQSRSRSGRRWRREGCQHACWCRPLNSVEATGCGWRYYLRHATVLVSCGQFRDEYCYAEVERVQIIDLVVVPSSHSKELSDKSGAHVIMRGEGGTSARRLAGKWGRNRLAPVALLRLSFFLRVKAS